MNASGKIFLKKIPGNMLLLEPEASQAFPKNFEFSDPRG